MKTGSSFKIRKETLTDQIAVLIREAIVNGEFTPGTMISLRELSQKWKVSRTPLREAARKIEAEGLIVSVPRKGFMVKMFSAEEVKEIYIIRESLEILAVKLACKNISTKELEKVEKIHNKIKALLKEYRTPNDLDIKTIQKLNRFFHFSIYKASKNKHLVDLISNLWDRSSTMIYCILSTPYRLKNTVKEHSEILKNLKNKDEIGVERALKKHLQISEDILLKYINKNKDCIR